MCWQVYERQTQSPFSSFLQFRYSSITCLYSISNNIISQSHKPAIDGEFISIKASFDSETLCNRIRTSIADHFAKRPSSTCANACKESEPEASTVVFRAIRVGFRESVCRQLCSVRRAHFKSDGEVVSWIDAHFHCRGRGKSREMVHPILYQRIYQSSDRDTSENWVVRSAEKPAVHAPESVGMIALRKLSIALFGENAIFRTNPQEQIPWVRPYGSKATQRHPP